MVMKGQVWTRRVRRAARRSKSAPLMHVRECRCSNIRQFFVLATRSWSHVQLCGVRRGVGGGGGGISPVSGAFLILRFILRILKIHKWGGVGWGGGWGVCSPTCNRPPPPRACTASSSSPPHPSPGSKVERSCTNMSCSVCVCVCDLYF